MPVVAVGAVAVLALLALLRSTSAATGEAPGPMIPASASLGDQSALAGLPPLGTDSGGTSNVLKSGTSTYTIQPSGQSTFSGGTDSAPPSDQSSLFQAVTSQASNVGATITASRQEAVASKQTYTSPAPTAVANPTPLYQARFK